MCLTSSLLQQLCGSRILLLLDDQLQCVTWASDEWLLLWDRKQIVNTNHEQVSTRTTRPLAQELYFHWIKTAEKIPFLGRKDIWVCAVNIKHMHTLTHIHTNVSIHQNPQGRKLRETHYQWDRQRPTPATQMACNTSLSRLYFYFIFFSIFTIIFIYIIHYPKKR